MEPNQPTSLFEMQADSTTQSHLTSISKWGKFFSITCLVFAAIYLLIIATRGREIIDQVTNLISLDEKLVGLLIAILVVVGGLCLAALYFLLRACVLIKQALISRNSDRLADAFKAFKVFFVISMIFSLLSILGSIIGMINS